MSQKSIALVELSTYLNDLLVIHKFDESTINGIQVANSGSISKIATAVSASLEAIEKAADLGAQALIVHHGIFRKNASQQLIGTSYKKIKKLIDHDIALLCYHLPLDAHQELGNNWKAAKDLGLQNLTPFLEFNKVSMAVKGTLSAMPFDEFKVKVEKYYGNQAAAVKVKDPISSVAIISGGAEKHILDVAAIGADCFITGRFDEPVWDQAHEENISFLGLGHYATETVGVKALAGELQNKFGIPCEFIRTENPF